MTKTSLLHNDHSKAISTCPILIFGLLFIQLDLQDGWEPCYSSFSDSEDDGDGSRGRRLAKKASTSDLDWVNSLPSNVSQGCFYTRPASSFLVYFSCKATCLASQSCDWRIASIVMTPSTAHSLHHWFHQHFVICHSLPELLHVPPIASPPSHLA